MILSSSSYNGINGYFDPLTLAIYENAPNENWREFEAEFKRNFSNKQFDYNKLLYEFWYLQAHLTNLHESNHFIRHSSSELGVLYTILLNLKNDNLHSLISKSVPKELSELLNNQIQTIDLIIDCLFSNRQDITQKQAVHVLNYFFKNLFDVKEDVFITRYPEYPVCPTKFLGYCNILEASAVFSEYELIKAKISDAPIVLMDLLNVKRRDFDSYFSLMVWLLEIYQFPPLCQVFNNLSLDVHIPFITSPPRTGIYFDEIHPGWRQYWFSQMIPKDDNFKFLFNKAEPINEVVTYNHELQNHLIHGISEFVTEKLNFACWESNSIALNEVSYSKFLKEIKAEKREIWNQASYVGILEHVFNSNNIFKQRCLKHPALVFGSSVRMYQEEGHKEINEIIHNVDINQNAYCLFSIQASEIKSIYPINSYANQLVAAYRTYAQSQVLHYYLNDYSKEDAIIQVLKIGRFGNSSNPLQEWFEKYIYEVADSYWK
ncbi:MAG: hypothetical protein U0Y08_03725 [Bacteroidia bacterium]